jgi:predicted Zn-dependent peptidase
MQPDLTTLSNAARVLRIPMPGVKSVTVLALVNAGRRYETEDVAGISHFLEHMVFKGTQNFANSQELASAIDTVGGEFNAFTSKEYTGYYVKLASRYLDTALTVVTDMLCTPKLREDDIRRESLVITEEINMYEDMPMRNIDDVFDELMYANSNLAGRVLGTKETVQSLNRDKFLEYIGKWYGFANVLIVVAGDDSVVKSPDLPKKIEEYLQKGGADRQAADHTPFLKDSIYGDERHRIVFKETEQAHFILGFPSFPRSDERRYALNLLATLLGKTMSSRLFTEIRDNRGLCYYIHASTDFYHDGGVFGAAAGVDPHRIVEAITATKQEFQALLAAKPVTETELQGAKQNIIGRLALEMEDSQSVAYWYGMRLLLDGKVETPEEVVKRIEQVSLDQVKSVGEQLIHEDQLRLALIGPFKNEDLEGV